MSADYLVSISTLRESLQRLTSDGLLIAGDWRGFEVAPVSVAEFRELAELRQILEFHAIELSFAAGDIEWEGRVLGAYHKLSQIESRMLKPGGPQSETWKRYDREFHQELISACGSDTMLQTHSVVYDKYLRYQMVAMVFRGEAAVREHRTLLDCALRRDIGAAQRVLITHIHDCVEDTVRRGALA